LAKTGKYKEIYFQKSWKTVSGDPKASTAQPDILAVRHDSKIDVWDVFSPGSNGKERIRTTDELGLKLQKGLNSITDENRRGKVGGEDGDGVIIPPSLKGKRF
jgi:hypothetical protein